MTAVANSTDNHDQSIGQGAARSGTSSRWKSICNRGLCRSRRMNDLDVVRKVQIVLNFRYP
jgi:hypothetical protein